MIDLLILPQTFFFSSMVTTTSENCTYLLKYEENEEDVFKQTLEFVYMTVQLYWGPEA